MTHTKRIQRILAMCSEKRISFKQFFAFYDRIYDALVQQLHFLILIIYYRATDKHFIRNEILSQIVIQLIIISLFET